MQKKIAKSVVLPSIMFPSLLAKDRKPDWRAKPSDWSDIRKDCPANSIALYAGHTADYSQYDNLGFTANCTGGYNVFIDGVQYGSTYASGAQCSITWSSLALTTGDDITTPSALKAHKIWIEPATEGNNITSLKSYRVAASGIEEQGILWAHFNLTNKINIRNSFSTYNGTYNVNLFAITAKNDLIKTTDTLKGIINQGTDKGFRCSQYIEYLPAFYSQNAMTPVDFQAQNATAKLHTIRLYGDSTYRLDYYSFSRSVNFKKIKTKKKMTTFSEIYNAFLGDLSLEELPDIDYSNAIAMQDFLTNAISLKDTVLDVSAATKLRKIGTYGSSSYFMGGLKGLRVSNEAPFDGAAPQINVNYTGLDRNALVQLFNDLPYNVGYEVVGSPTISSGVASGFSASDYVNTSLSLNNTEEDWEMVIDATTTSLVDSGLGNFFGNSSGMGTIGISVNYGQKLSAYISNSNDERLLNGAIGARVYSSGVNYLLKISQKKINNNVFNFMVKSSDDGGQTWITEYDVNSTYPIRTSAPIYFGSAGNSSFATQYFRGNINLNNTYIKINGVYWFNGQPAMTKTLSCVGATGTADLTADDKDIALNKGWSLTLS